MFPDGALAKLSRSAAGRRDEAKEDHLRRLANRRLLLLHFVCRNYYFRSARPLLFASPLLHVFFSCVLDTEQESRDEQLRVLRSSAAGIYFLAFLSAIDVCMKLIQEILVLR